MGWENVKAAETFAIAAFELCDTLREIHGLPKINYEEKYNFHPRYYQEGRQSQPIKLYSEKEEQYD